MPGPQRISVRPRSPRSPRATESKTSGWLGSIPSFQDLSLPSFQYAKQHRHVLNNRAAAKVFFARHSGKIAVGMVLLLWVLWTFVLPIRIYGFPALLVGYPGQNLRRTWVRIRLEYQVAADARRSAELPRYKPLSPWPPPVYVVSMLSAKERRASMQGQLEKQKIDFRWWDAVDGTGPLPDDEVLWYVSGNRLKRYVNGKPGSLAYRKAACDLSHLRLMHDMLAAGRDVQIILEDDAELLDSDFLARLNTTMAALPEDWEVLWLNHGAPILRVPQNLGGWVGAGVRMCFDNSGTIGMVYKRTFALKVLNDAQIGNKEIDNLMNDMAQLGRVRSYVADPPLVAIHTAGFVSQIEVD